MRERSIAALVVKSGDAITGLISETGIVHALTLLSARVFTVSVAAVAPDGASMPAAISDAASGRNCQFRGDRSG